MVRERMVRFEFQDGIERGDDFFSAGIWLTFERPLVPWPKIHHRLGEERADIDVLGILLPHFAHGIGVGLIERRTILRLRIGITMTERLDQRALHGRSFVGVLLREREFFPREFSHRRRDERVVDVWTAASATPQYAIAQLGSIFAAS